ncbi:hypothetical protein BABA_04519 [Neobacillus bataviensis LMG 21833]|uniref:Uncharacterized protein n=1 Tax=Neobacillus bataviensis LMG 21833 TaxID=1117379 RepID=K6DDS6_9BACI|nr:hypothetical protein [Neobacillus bataviensis]EKN70677.1 hypothetical protein BABA_04519 [Neobacillus bataviensis LMG 21833]
MNIGIAIVLLTYVTILVLSYAIIIFIQENDDDKGNMIINKAYQYYYSILIFSILIVLGLIKLPHITLDSQTTSYLIIASKFISVLTLGGSIYALSKKKCKN